MAMIEAYRIGVELVLGGDLAAGVEALIPGLTRLDGNLAQANAGAKTLAVALGSVAATGPGIGQAAGAVERLCAAMASMNRAAAHWQAGAGMPAADAATRGGGDGGVRAAKRPSVMTRQAPQAADALPAAADTAATIPIVPAQTAKNEVAPNQRVANQGSTARSLVQAITPPPASRLVEAPGPPDPTPRAAEPRPRRIVLPPPALPASVTAPVVVGVPPTNAKPSTAAVTRPPAGVEQVLPLLARPVPGVASDQPARAAAATYRNPATAREQVIQVRDVVLPQLGGTAGIEQPAPPGSNAKPAMRRNLPSSPVAAMIPDPAPIGTMRAPAISRAPSVEHRASAAPLATPPAIAWPNLAAAMVEAKKGPVTQAFASPKLPNVGVTHASLPDSRQVRSGSPVAADRWRAWGDAGRSGPAAPVRATAPSASNAGLPTAPSYHPQGSQGGATIQHVTYVQLDERTIARAVTRQQLRMMGGQVSGTLRPDPSIAPQYGAHLLEL